jgi:hypothetical protein
VVAGPPGQRVSWLVTGVRQDSWALANPLVVEREKTPEDLGDPGGPPPFLPPAASPAAAPSAARSSAPTAARAGQGGAP